MYACVLLAAQDWMFSDIDRSVHGQNCISSGVKCVHFSGQAYFLRYIFDNIFPIFFTVGHV